LDEFATSIACPAVTQITDISDAKKSRRWVPSEYWVGGTVASNICWLGVERWPDRSAAADLLLRQEPEGEEDEEEDDGKDDDDEPDDGYSDWA
jgi:hypothetical protein